MPALNKVMLIGNLGKDPEIRKTSSDRDVVNFSICTTERYKDKDGKQQERSEWHNIVAWGPLAVTCDKYLSKGKPVYIEGRITQSTWNDKETDEKRYRTDIVANNVQFLESRKASQDSEEDPFEG
ncbi:MAG: single-stranded DNA-binding protein [bacterium]|nr:single-stranded DNA-binding protein [bacterium]